MLVWEFIVYRLLFTYAIMFNSWNSMVWGYWSSGSGPGVTDLEPGCKSFPSGQIRNAKMVLDRMVFMGLLIGQQAQMEPSVHSAFAMLQMWADVGGSWFYMWVDSLKMSHFRGAKPVGVLGPPLQSTADWGGNRNWFLTVSEAAKSKIREGVADSILDESLFLACTGPPSCCVLTGAFFSGVSSSSYKDTSPIGLEPHPYDLI